MKNEIALQLLRILGVIFATAGVAMTLNWAIRGKQRGQADMRKRFLVEVFILAGVFVPTYLGGAWLLFAAVVLGCLCAAELYGTFESKQELYSEIREQRASGFYVAIQDAMAGDDDPRERLGRAIRAGVKVRIVGGRLRPFTEAASRRGSSAGPRRQSPL